VLELTFGAAGGAEPLTLTVADLTYGLPPEGADLLEARPVNAVPSQDGDVSVVMNEVTLPTP